mmetsp:Transcript_59910/g.188124  ORF Transcript_59910/g.188124 Transcript_59910/m.188124 type:complete len:328 (-) Transcript_59910:676-1659(-)
MGRSRVWLREGGRRQARLRPQLLLWRRAPAGRRDRLRKRSARPPYTWEVGGCEHPEGHPDGRGRRSGDGRARHRDRVERHWRLRLPVHGRREAGLRPPQFLRRQGCPHRRLQADGHHQAGPQEPRQVVRGCGQGPGSHARGRGWRRRPGPHQCPQRCTGGPRGLRPRRHRCGGCDSCAAAAVAAAAAPAARQAAPPPTMPGASRRVRVASCRSPSSLCSPQAAAGQPPSRACHSLTLWPAWRMAHRRAAPGPRHGRRIRRPSCGSTRAGRGAAARPSAALSASSARAWTGPRWRPSRRCCLGGPSSTRRRRCSRVSAPRVPGRCATS